MHESSKDTTGVYEKKSKDEHKKAKVFIFLNFQ